MIDVTGGVPSAGVVAATEVEQEHLAAVDVAVVDVALRLELWPLVESTKVIATRPGTESRPPVRALATPVQVVAPANAPLVTASVTGACPSWVNVTVPLRRPTTPPHTPWKLLAIGAPSTRYTLLVVGGAVERIDERALELVEPHRAQIEDEVVDVAAGPRLVAGGRRQRLRVVADAEVAVGRVLCRFDQQAARPDGRAAAVGQLAGALRAVEAVVHPL